MLIFKKILQDSDSDPCRDYNSNLVLSNLTVRRNDETQPFRFTTKKIIDKNIIG